MNKDELINDPAIRLAVITARTAMQERTDTRMSRVRGGRRKWIGLLVLAIVIVLIGAIVLSHVDTHELFPLHLDLVSEHFS